MASVHFRDISNRDLINNTRELVRSATTLEVKLLYHLDEIRSRGIEGCMGHKSPMQFAIEGLGMTPDQAAKRSAAVTNCRQRPALVDIKLALPAEVLERWEDAKALVCGAEMATMEDALTRIVDDYLERYHPLAKAQRAAARLEKKAQVVAKLEDQHCRAATKDEGGIESSAPKLKTRATKGGTLSRYIPKHVHHALYVRANGRCENTGCAATQHLQIDHKQAFSRGGRHDLANLQLLCPSCHKQKTLREFGHEWQRSELRRRVDAVDWMSYRRGAYIPPVVDN